MFQKVNSILMYVLIAVGVILMVMTMTSGLTPEDGDCTDCGAVGAFIGMSYALLIAGIVAAIGGAVMQVILNPKQIKGALIGIGGLVVVMGLSYALADGTVEPIYGDVTETTSRLSGAGLYAFYILFVGAVLSIAYSSVSRILK